MCIGFKDKSKRIERSERLLNYHIVKGWADPKSFKQTIQQWWPIDGDQVQKIKMPSKARLKKLHELFKNIGNHG